MASIIDSRQNLLVSTAVLGSLLGLALLAAAGVLAAVAVRYAAEMTSLPRSLLIGQQLIRSTPPLPLKDMDFFMAPPSAPLRANQEADRNGPNSTPCRLICTSNPEWPIRSSKRSKLLPLQVFKGELDLGAQFKLK